MEKVVRIACRSAIALLALACFGAAKPETAGDEGQRAFDDLAKLYAGEPQSVGDEQAIEDLKSPDGAVRKAGAYLLALLKQSQADESNGRAAWKRLPYFGGGSENAAREFRKALANELKTATPAAEALDAARWLIREERVASNAQAGVTLLVRIDSPRIAGTYRQLLTPPHPVTEVAVKIVEDAGRRKLGELGPILRTLCNEHRSAVREAARKSAATLGIRDIPPFAPEKALAAGSFVEGELRKVLAMILPQVPLDAKWGEMAVEYKSNAVFSDGGDTEPPPPQVVKTRGWLIAQDASAYRMVDRFGTEHRFGKKQSKWTEGKLADAAAALLEARAPAKGDSDDKRESLSRRGGLTGQFEPGFISVPEALAAAWLMERGDLKTAAGVILPRFDAAADQRWIADAVADMLAKDYHQQLLDAFTRQRDYKEAIRIATHLGKKPFEHWNYYERTQELAAQLAKRQDEDFKTLVLPTPEEWKQLKAKLSRREQVEFLARRLRLLNAFQWSQPGGVDFEMDQTREPARWDDPNAKPVTVINPLVTLDAMGLEVKDLDALLPSIEDENFVLAYGYWRDFHPTRYLYRVQEFATTLINRAATREIVDLRAFDAADAGGKRKIKAEAEAWIRSNASRTRESLLLAKLEKATDFDDVRAAAGELAERKSAAAVPLMLKRLAGSTKQDEQAFLARCCFSAAPEQCVDPARQWMKQDNQRGFWGAMIVVKSGDRKKNEGLAELTASLERDGKELQRYKHAFDLLLTDGRKEAVDLAATVVKRLDKEGDFTFGAWDTETFIHRLLFAGRQEAVEFISDILDRSGDGRPRNAKIDGKNVEITLDKGDLAAEWTERFRNDGYQYNWREPSAEKRKQEREKIKAFFRQQVELARAGKPTALKPVQHYVTMQYGPRIDAP